MATSKVYQGFIPTLSKDYTDFITLESGVSTVAFRLEQVDRNIWAITFAGEMQTALPAHSRRVIAHYDLTKLPPLTAHIPGFHAANDNVYPQNLFFTATGDIEVFNLSDIASTVYSANGLIYRRLP